MLFAYRIDMVKVITSHYVWCEALSGDDFDALWDIPIVTNYTKWLRHVKDEVLIVAQLTAFLSQNEQEQCDQLAFNTGFLHSLTLRMPEQTETSTQYPMSVGKTYILHFIRQDPVEGLISNANFGTVVYNVSDHEWPNLRIKDSDWV